MKFELGTSRQNAKRGCEALYHNSVMELMSNRNETNRKMRVNKKKSKFSKISRHDRKNRTPLPASAANRFQIWLDQNEALYKCGGFFERKAGNGIFNIEIFQYVPLSDIWLADPPDRISDWKKIFKWIECFAPHNGEHAVWMHVWRRLLGGVLLVLCGKLEVMHAQESRPASRLTTWNFRCW